MTEDVAIQQVISPRGLTKKTRTGLEVFQDQYRLSCPTCPAKDFCPRFDANAKSCFYLKEDTIPDLGTQHGIISALQQLTYANLMRLRRAIDLEMTSPSISKDITSLSGEVRACIDILERLSVRFGLIEAKPEEGDIKVYLAESVNILQVEQNMQDKLRTLRQLRRQQQEPEDQIQLPTEIATVSNG